MSDGIETTEIRIEKKFEWAFLRVLKKMETIIRDTGHGRIEIVIADKDIQDVRAMDTLKNPGRSKKRSAIDNH